MVEGSWITLPHHVFSSFSSQHIKTYLAWEQLLAVLSTVCLWQMAVVTEDTSKRWGFKDCFNQSNGGVEILFYPATGYPAALALGGMKNFVWSCHATLGVETTYSGRDCFYFFF